MDKASLLAAAFPDVEPDSQTAFYASEGDLFQALMFSDLFWPRCFEVHGAVFLAVGGTSPEWVDEGIRKVRDASPATPTWPDFVDSFNWFEIPYLFGQLRDPMESVDDASVILAGVLQQSWSARLTVLYPERVFNVRICEDGPEALHVEVRQTSPALPERMPM